jgi:hypothetical protein
MEGKPTIGNVVDGFIEASSSHGLNLKSIEIDHTYLSVRWVAGERTVLFMESRERITEWIGAAWPEMVEYETRRAKSHFDLFATTVSCASAPAADS